MEVDAGVQASVTALLKMRLSIVVHALASALEQLSKVGPDLTKLNVASNRLAGNAPIQSIHASHP